MTRLSVFFCFGINRRSSILVLISSNNSISELSGFISLIIPEMYLEKSSLFFFFTFEVSPSFV